MTDTIAKTIPAPEAGGDIFGFSESAAAEFLNAVGEAQARNLTERFDIVMPLNRGGMGQVFLAREVLSGRFVALKVMQEYALGDRSLVEQFVREATITARLQHPNIIPVFDLGFLNNNQLYYTMQYVEGKSFSQLLRSPTADTKLIVLRDAARGVDFAHSQKLWHRDIKPQNILVGNFGDTYAIDWGLVSVQPGCQYALQLPQVVVENLAGTTTLVANEQALPEERVAQTLVSASGPSLVGTPAYMAPEQCLGDTENMGVRSDVWAFGIMLFETLTGRHPIANLSALSTHQILAMTLEQEFPRTSDIACDVPPQLDELCHWMLQKATAARMPSLQPFITGIDRYLQQRTVHHLRPIPPVPHPTPIDSALQERIAELERENADLRDARDRVQAKLDVLHQISDLWSQYARL